MYARAQGSLEYLLLIAGAILVSVVVLILIISSSQTGDTFLSNHLGGYSTIGLNSGMVSPNPVSGPPLINSFVLSPDAEPASLQASAALSNVKPGTTVHLLVWNDSLAPPSISIANFSTLSTNEWAYQTTLPANQSSVYTLLISEIMPQAANSYSAALLVCNSPAQADCALSQNTSLSGNPNQANGNISISFGSTEMVWDWSVQQCEPHDVPDFPARALVNTAGELLLTRGNAPNFRILFSNPPSPNFNAFTNTCSVALPSSQPDFQDYSTPDTFKDREWIGSLYRKPGDTIIHALIHNEYHDPRFNSSTSASGGSGNGPCKYNDSTSANPCRYFSMTYGSSMDGGRTFTMPNSTPVAPNHLVASSHIPWNPLADPPNAPTYGVIQNTNIVKRGNYYYTLAHVIHDPVPSGGSRGVCVGRTNDLSNPSSWRFWDGQSYSLSLTSPYIAGHVPVQCAFVSQGQIGNMSHSLTYNTYLNKYLLVAQQGAGGCTIRFSTSDDLITWTDSQAFRNCTTPTGTMIYPSIIDHAQLPAAISGIDPNFEFSGQKPHLYYTNWIAGLDRDLERIPITLCVGAQPCP